MELKEISDKKLFPFETHNKISENYNNVFARREFSNKLTRYRNVLLSYAEGDVLECGIGTGISLKHYNAAKITSFIGIDWSSQMLEKAFQTKEELIKTDSFPFSKNKDYETKGKAYFKIMVADAHDLPFKDDQFDTVVDSLSL